MVRDLQLDSRRWEQEVAQGQASYTNSDTHRSRQYYGPSQTPGPEPPAAAYPQSYPQVHPQPHQQAHGQQPSAVYAGSGYYQTYQQEPGYTYAPPQHSPAYPPGYAPNNSYPQGGYSATTSAHPYSAAAQPRTYHQEAAPSYINTAQGYYASYQNAAQAAPRDSVSSPPGPSAARYGVTKTCVTASVTDNSRSSNYQYPSASQRKSSKLNSPF